MGWRPSPHAEQSEVHLRAVEVDGGRNWAQLGGGRVGKHAGNGRARVQSQATQAGSQHVRVRLRLLLLLRGQGGGESLVVGIVDQRPISPVSKRTCGQQASMLLLLYPKKGRLQLSPQGHVLQAALLLLLVQQEGACAG